MDKRGLNDEKAVRGGPMKKGDDSEIIRLHVEEGKSFREIGRLIGISHVAVRKRYLKTTGKKRDIRRRK